MYFHILCVEIFHFIVKIINLDLPLQNVQKNNIGALMAISSMLAYDEDEDGDNDDELGLII